MAKTIEFSYEGKDYTLEYTKRTVMQMEAEGFVVQDIDRKPMTILPAMFAGAFKAHHRWIKQEEIDKIYAHMPDKEKLVAALAEMYNEPIIGLMDEPESTEGNVDWIKSW